MLAPLLVRDESIDLVSHIARISVGAHAHPPLAGDERGVLAHFQQQTAETVGVDLPTYRRPLRLYVGVEHEAPPVGLRQIVTAAQHRLDLLPGVATKMHTENVVLHPAARFPRGVHPTRPLRDPWVGHAREDRARSGRQS